MPVHRVCSRVPGLLEESASSCPVAVNDPCLVEVEGVTMLDRVIEDQ